MVDARPAVFLCVNVSAREIQQPGFVDAVREALSEAGMAASRLSLEITETALLRATPKTIETLESLRQLGVRIAIDDFGTGYFSLSHLRQFPVDVLKIASEFVQVPDSDAKTEALAGAIVAMGRSLGIRTVAEGIETAEQAERMRGPRLRVRPGLSLRHADARERGDVVLDVPDGRPRGRDDGPPVHGGEWRRGRVPGTVRWVRPSPPDAATGCRPGLTEGSSA